MQNGLSEFRLSDRQVTAGCDDQFTAGTSHHPIQQVGILSQFLTGLDRQQAGHLRNLSVKEIQIFPGMQLQLVYDCPGFCRNR